MYQSLVPFSRIKFLDCCFCWRICFFNWIPKYLYGFPILIFLYVLLVPILHFPLLPSLTSITTPAHHLYPLPPPLRSNEYSRSIFTLIRSRRLGTAPCCIYLWILFWPLSSISLHFSFAFSRNSPSLLFVLLSKSFTHFVTCPSNDNSGFFNSSTITITI